MAIKVASYDDFNLDKITAEINQEGIKVVVYFFSPELEKYNLQKNLVNAFPSAVCFGASMIGGWSSQGVVAKGITLMSLSGDEVDEVYVSFQEGVKEDPVKAAKAAISGLKQQAAGKIINPDEYLGLIFFDGLCLGELIIKEFSLDQDLNMAFVGGAAADELTFTKTIIGAGSQMSGDGLVAAILKMKIPFYFDHYVHYIPTGTSFTITRVETMKRVAWEIDGEPAAVFYARQIGINDLNKLDATVFAKHPVGLKFGDSVYVRSPNAVIDGVGLQFYCYIEAGTKVFLLKQGDIIANAQKSLTTAAQFLPGIQGCLLFNCVLRYLELKELDKLNEFNNVFSSSPMIGFNTYGEELFTHHNQTLTAVFFGTPLEEGTADPYKTKRLFHYTDSKLKSLVFDIVSRSELLNITISYLKGSIDKYSDETALSNYETIKKSLGAMIYQANISREDIEKLLIVYQNNVEKTGEYVFNIVDEIRAQNRRLVELKEKAEMASNTKSNFLASISHEIRTPMNAITGMAELLLRGNLSDENRGYARDIKQASNNLISIINDLLDFSKIEAGRMEIIPAKYLLASLINDVVSIIRMRLIDRPIRFYTNIDGSIPVGLIGDEVRIRQILLNLLSNAVKFTPKGNISISITQAKKENKKIWLEFNISDTGSGIKPEDCKKLFDDFIQVDTKKNRSIEGTGLGLPITKRLCELMGGNITVKSEYKKGSIFTVTIPQEVYAPEPFAVVESPLTKKVLIYERRTVYSQSVSWSLENMYVPHAIVSDYNELAEALNRENWFYLFTGYGLFNKIKPVLDSLPKEKIPQIALMVEWGTETYIPYVRYLHLPVQSLSIANTLNGRADTRTYYENSGNVNINHFTIPNTRILIVDDIPTNIKVAEGLLSPYKAIIDSCLSGTEAIELVKQNEYDLIFMDHMMPVMDGIETTNIIRAWEEERFRSEPSSSRGQIPIIALTANAVSGMREMFIDNGFDDFLPKPIDVSKLEDVLDMWIPTKLKIRQGVRQESEKNIIRKTHIALSDLPGIDINSGILMTGGSEENYRKLLFTFQKDAENRLPLLRSAASLDDLPDFITCIHALKSASAYLGMTNITKEAASIETAGHEKNLSLIQEKIPAFIKQLEEIIDGIRKFV